jgi:hypothetical protein
MLFGITTAALSSVFMAIMMIADKLMVRNCYNGSKISAWFVSSVAGSCLGLLLTAVCWIIFSTFSESVTLIGLFQTALNLFFWSGFFVLVSGIFAVQLLYHYFACFTEDAHIATISSWIAATPIIIFITALATNQFTNVFFDIEYISVGSLQLGFIISITLATLCLVAFEVVTNKETSGKKIYAFDLCLMIICNILYIVSLEFILKQEPAPYNHLVYIVALLPYFWIGFAAGGRVYLSKTKREEIKRTWRSSIRNFLPIILFVELIGMLVFYFEYFGLSELTASYVALIVGAHIVIVYLIDYFFINKEYKSTRTTIIEFALVICTVIGITTASFYI